MYIYIYIYTYIHTYIYIYIPNDNPALMVYTIITTTSHAYQLASSMARKATVAKAIDRAY